MRIFLSEFHNNFLLSVFNFKLRSLAAAVSSKCNYCDLGIFFCGFIMLWIHSWLVYCHKDFAELSLFPVYPHTGKWILFVNPQLLFVAMLKWCRNSQSLVCGSALCCWSDVGIPGVWFISSCLWSWVPLNEERSLLWEILIAFKLSVLSVILSPFLVLSPLLSFSPSHPGSLIRVHGKLCVWHFLPVANKSSHGISQLFINYCYFLLLSLTTWLLLAFLWQAASLFTFKIHFLLTVTNCLCSRGQTWDLKRSQFFPPVVSGSCAEDVQNRENKVKTGNKEQAV